MIIYRFNKHILGYSGEYHYKCIIFSTKQGV